MLAESNRAERGIFPKVIRPVPRGTGTGARQGQGGGIILLTCGFPPFKFVKKCVYTVRLAPPVILFF